MITADKWLLASLASALLCACSSDSNSEEEAASAKLEDDIQDSVEVTNGDQSEGSVCGGDRPANPDEPSISNVTIGLPLEEAASLFECKGYSVNYKTTNSLFSGGQTQWTSEIIASKSSDGNEDIIRAFVVDLDGPDDPRVFGIKRRMYFRNNEPTFDEFEEKFRSAYTKQGSASPGNGAGTWYVEHNGQVLGQVLNENDAAFDRCKPFVQSSEVGCGYAQGYFLERSRANPDLVISAQVAIHDRARDSAEFSRLTERIEEDKRAAAGAAREAGRANVPDL